ncbi:hypothetical protein E2C01_092682 [Portunus trituberculatus]|uniref:Uncharacterized protein n=1 Tax=Portunus trituberculatus TaxID=210409 RepID=A0A5B7JKX2_PORTR|nr:hypothetical protein [Portunus trituberculatus]
MIFVSREVRQVAGGLAEARPALAPFPHPSLNPSPASSLTSPPISTLAMLHNYRAAPLEPNHLNLL